MKQILIFFFSAFLIGCSGYTKKDGKVYLRSSNEARLGVQYSEVAADYDSFEVIDHDVNLDLAKDKDHVFYGTQKIENADPKTFEQVDRYFWRDKNRVYIFRFGLHQYVVEGADPATFSILENDNWARDKSGVFYNSYHIENAQIDAFESIDENWARDGESYFFQHHRIDSLDYESAKIVLTYFGNESGKRSEYIKDRNHVFFQYKKVIDANPKTFVADGIGTFGHDDKNMFDWEKNAGPITESYRATYIQKTASNSN